LLTRVSQAVFRPLPNPWTPAFLQDIDWRGWSAATLVTVLGYFAMGLVVSRFFAAYGLFPAPIWLPTAIATIAAMVGGARLWPGIFLGSCLINGAWFEAPLVTTAIISTMNAAGPVLGALILRRLRPARGLFNSFPGVLAFIACMIGVSPAISAGGGTVAMMLGHPFDSAQIYSIWVTWWLTDAGGTLYLVPAMILWLGLEREDETSQRRAQAGFQRRDLAVWAWIAVVSTALFLTPPLRGADVRTAFPFLLVVPLSWIALRMSLRSAYTLVSLVAIVATVGTVAGYGPFQDHGLANPLQLVGALVVLLATNVLTIVALVSERQEAESANKAKSMFLAMTSHELKTPLNAIIGFSSLINSEAMGSTADPRHADYIALIKSSGEHLLRLINDLLDISKIEAGRFDLQEQRLPLAALIEDTMALVRLQAEAKSIVLQTDLAASAIAIEGDAKAWRQILLNLLSNAVKFTPAGGTVGVKPMLGADGRLMLRVWDTGIGIPEQALERVFVPFERVRMHGHAVDGTGLGLSIARGLVHLHGGTISLESKVGEGTTVKIVVPAHRVIKLHSPLAAAS
jgi:two-component system, cell cycle sensor histidine kinase PleC